MFNSCPQHYASNSSKVFFVISYLKKSTLEWFGIGVMESDPRLAPTWHASWPDLYTLWTIESNWNSGNRTLSPIHAVQLSYLGVPSMIQHAGLLSTMGGCGLMIPVL